MDEKKQLNIEVGSYLVIQITGRTGSYIAEVTHKEPFLEVKVEEEETGFSHLFGEDFIVQETDSVVFQNDMRNGTQNFLQSRKEGTVFSGLRNLGIESGELCAFCPA